MVEQGKLYKTVSYFILIIMSCLAVFPFLLLIASSFTSEPSLLQYGYGFWPKEFSLEAYRYLWENAAVIARAYGITLLVTVAGTTVGVTCILLLAYPLSMPDMPGRRVLSFLVYFTMLFNGGLVPTYMLYTNYFHLKNNILALIIPTLLMKAYYVILARSFFSTSVPKDILEAARVDGASEFRILFSIVRPMATPIIATIALMQGLAYWNDWTNGLYYINQKNLYSIQQLLNTMIQDIKALQSSFDSTVIASAANMLPTTAVRMAIAVIGVLPMIIVYPYFQKFFIKGLTLGAVKG